MVFYHCFSLFLLWSFQVCFNALSTLIFCQNVLSELSNVITPMVTTTFIKETWKTLDLFPWLQAGFMSLVGYTAGNFFKLLIFAFVAFIKSWDALEKKYEHLLFLELLILRLHQNESREGIHWALEGDPCPKSIWRTTIKEIITLNDFTINYQMSTEKSGIRLKH